MLRLQVPIFDGKQTLPGKCGSFLRVISRYYKGYFKGQINKVLSNA
jgi:hypothetical protein